MYNIISLRACRCATQYTHVKDKIICNLAISAFDVNEFESDLNASNALNNYLI